MARMLLGERITSLRKSKGMSQELLAENSNVSLRTIQRIEAGAAAPRLHTIKTLADALGVPVEEFISAPENNELNQSDVDGLMQINFSALAGLLIPLSNIVLAVLIWQKNKALPLVNVMGRKIISFQIIWTLATLLVVFLIPLIQYSILKSYVIGRFPPTIIVVYVTMLIMNVLCIVRAARQLQNGKSDIYTFVPTLF
ncbi:hypothetical protein WSM22_27130 [Cytophagales bacterium WSM2-2]|nr:hypothetical protein WSM22_27130 [Cytophagales bacterium WSM2-2]